MCACLHQFMLNTQPQLNFPQYYKMIYIHSLLMSNLNCFIDTICLVTVMIQHKMVELCCLLVQGKTE